MYSFALYKADGRLLFRIPKEISLSAHALTSYFLDYVKVILITATDDYMVTQGVDKDVSRSYVGSRNHMAASQFHTYLAGNKFETKSSSFDLPWPNQGNPTQFFDFVPVQPREATSIEYFQQRRYNRHPLELLLITFTMWAPRVTIVDKLFN